MEMEIKATPMQYDREELAFKASFLGNTLAK